MKHSLRLYGVPLGSFVLAVVLSGVAGGAPRALARQAAGPTGSCAHEAYEVPGLGAVQTTTDGAAGPITPPALDDFKFLNKPLPAHVNKVKYLAKGRDGSLALRAGVKNGAGKIQEERFTNETNRGEVGFVFTTGDRATCCHDGRFHVSLAGEGEILISPPGDFARGDGFIGNNASGPMTADAKAVYDQNCNGVLDHTQKLQKVFVHVFSRRNGRSDRGLAVATGFDESQTIVNVDGTSTAQPPVRQVHEFRENSAVTQVGVHVGFPITVLNDGKKFRDRESTTYAVTNGSVRAFCSRVNLDGVFPEVKAEMALFTEDGIHSVDVTEDKLKSLQKN